MSRCLGCPRCAVCHKQLVRERFHQVVNSLWGLLNLYRCKLKDLEMMAATRAFCEFSLPQSCWFSASRSRCAVSKWTGLRSIVFTVTHWYGNTVMVKVDAQGTLRFRLGRHDLPIAMEHLTDVRRHARCYRTGLHYGDFTSTGIHALLLRSQIH